jgi:hypothetical protein
MDVNQRQGEALSQTVGQGVDRLPNPLSDTVFAVFMLIMGFCFWEWGVLWQDYAGIGETLFFLLCIAASLVYLHLKQIHQNWRSLLLLASALLGALPFAIYGARDVNVLILPFETCACLLWLAYSCKTQISQILSGYLAFDLLNQILIVPFSNFGRLFVSLFRRQSGTGRKIGITFLIVVVSLIISIPVFNVILLLLRASDEGFAQLLISIGEQLAFINIDQAITWAVKFLFGIPVACYIFGALWGNAHHHHTDSLKHAGLEQSFYKAHRVVRLAFIVPVSLLVIIYLAYFAAMGSYLFSALDGALPTSYTYAQYARAGFFELCGVATINLVIMGLVYLIAKRNHRHYPLVLRLLTAVLTLLTCLLVVTAASKMLLYINIYGLTPLRLYTSCFMLFLLIVFVVLLVWHLRPFNAARPIVITAVALFLALSLANTDGMIARFNVDRYLSGETTEIDVQSLAWLSDAALPALYELRDQTSDPLVLSQVNSALDQHLNGVQTMFSDSEERNLWVKWNLMSQQMRYH